MPDSRQSIEELIEELTRLRKQLSILTKDAGDKSNQRKKTEEALQKSELKYRALFERNNDAVFILDLQGETVSVNQRAKELFGYENDELLQVPKRQLVASYEYENAEKQLAQVLVDETLLFYERVFCKKDGTEFHGEVNASLVYDDKGKPLHIQSLIRDITARKQAEAVQRKRLEELQTIYNLSQAVGRADNLQDIYHDALQGLQNVLNADRASILLFDDEKVMRFAAWHGLSEEFRKAVDGRSLWPPEEKNPQPILIPDVQNDKSLGACMSVMIREGIQALGFIPISHGAKLLGVFMVCYDHPHQFDRQETQVAQTISRHVAYAVERKKSERALKESEEKYRLVVEHANEAILVAQDGMFKFFNEKTTEMLGYTRAELLSMPFLNIIHTKDKDMVQERHLRRLHGETLANFYRFRVIDKNGNVRWVQINAVRIQWENQPATLNFLVDITDMKVAEKALHESEERFRQLVEGVPDGIYRSTRDGRLLAVNSALVTMLGYGSHEELLKLNIGKDLYFKPEEREAVLQKLKQDKAKSSIFRLKKKDGSELWVEEHGLQVASPKNRSICYEGVIRDITDRKKAEDERENMLSLLTATLDSTADGILVVNTEGKLVSFNKQFTEMWAIPRSILESRESNQVLSYVSNQLKNPEEFIAKVKELYAQPEAESYDVLEFRDGRVFERYSQPQRIGKKIVGRVWSFRDTTERIQAVEDLKQSEERFRDLFDNAPDIYIILDPNGKITDLNQRGLYKLEYTADEIVGKSVTDFIHADDLKTAGLIMEHIHKTGQPPKSIEVRLIPKTGEPIWVSKEFSLLKSKDGALQAVRVACRDITDRKQLQEELARSHRLESAGRVAGQIAHDFNNLLTPLTAYPTLIRDELPQHHPVLELVEEIESSAIKIAEINQQLLALGRRGGHYSMEPIDLNEIVERVLHSAKLPPQVVVEKNFADDLLLIKGGAAQLTRALINLFINAKEAMQGIGVLTITTRNIYLDEKLRGYQTVARGEYVKLEISDSGVGIEEETLDKIFEPFFSTKKMDRRRGSGLGLSVVHGVVEDHQGYISVDTKVGQGTRFSLYFPVARDVSKQEIEPVMLLTGHHEKILFVDDDPVQRKVVTQLLERLSYQVITLESGEAAVMFLKKHPQDLLILDMVMHGIDGAETYRRILEFRPKQKAILLSGYAKSQQVQEALRLGAGCFISKPVILTTLAPAVRRELDKNAKS